MVRVFKLDSYADGIISTAEAKEEGIKVTGLPLASIEDCRNLVAKTIAEGEGWTGAFGGKIKVVEGTFEFNFDNNEYEQVQ